MNYYERFMGDYGKKTGRLSLIKHGAYALLLDAYYSEEEPLPADYDELFRICRAMDKGEREAVKVVADKFFPVAIDGMRHNERADEEIAKARKRIQASKENGRKGGRKAKPNPTDNQTGNPPGYLQDTQQGTRTGVHHTPYPSKPIQEITASTTNGSSGTEGSSPLSSRFGQILQLLSRLEAERGKEFGPVSASDLKINAWIDAGVSDDQIRVAHAFSVARRAKDNDPSPVNVGLVDSILAATIDRPQEASKIGVTALPWHQTASGIEAKGRELGVDPPSPDTGGFPAFKVRVYEAAGYQEEKAA